MRITQNMVATQVLGNITGALARLGTLRNLTTEAEDLDSAYYLYPYPLKKVHGTIEKQLWHDRPCQTTFNLTGEAGDEIWSLLMLAARLEEANAQAAAGAEPAFLAKYTFNLARAFNLFYHRHRIIAEEDEVKRAVLIAAADITRRRLTSALATLGITVPERM